MRSSGAGSVLRFLLGRAVAALRHLLPATPEPVEPVYYVTRYLDRRYGTMPQLEAGLGDHRTTEPPSADIHARLITAWQAMKGAADALPEAYRVNGEWRPIISEAFGPLTTALDGGDRRALNDLLPNFFRRFGDFFGEPTNTTSEPFKRARCEFHENHAWTSGSRNALYQPMGGFQHWNLSQVEPSRSHFKWLHMIPAPFHGDLYGEFFEWLYLRRATHERQP